MISKTHDSPVMQFGLAMSGFLATSLFCLTSFGQPADPNADRTMSEPDHGEKVAGVEPTAVPAPLGAAEDPFAQLARQPRQRTLKTLRSVRLRRDTHSADLPERKRIRVSVRSIPRGARIYHRKRLVGTTPLTVSTTAAATPMDLVIQARGKMVLRTRIQRNATRTYTFKLTPAKID